MEEKYDEFFCGETTEEPIIQSENAVFDYNTDTSFSFSYPKVKNRIILGDFNIAPFENDVWSHKSLLNVVSHTKSETNYFSKLLKYGAFEDIIRNNFKHDDKIYSWWSYRNKDWKKSNRGRRLDHILISKNIKKYIQSVKIYRSIREEKKPSDHVPISITLGI